MTFRACDRLIGRSTVQLSTPAVVR